MLGPHRAPYPFVKPSLDTRGHPSALWAFIFAFMYYIGASPVILDKEEGPPQAREPGFGPLRYQFGT
jgi:hypothetical protein